MRLSVVLCLATFAVVACHTATVHLATQQGATGAVQYPVGQKYGASAQYPEGGTTAVQTVRQKRGLIAAKLGLLGAGALGAGVLGAGAIGAGALGLGALGVGAAGAGLIGAGLIGAGRSYGGGYYHHHDHYYHTPVHYHHYYDDDYYDDDYYY